MRSSNALEVIVLSLKSVLSLSLGFGLALPLLSCLKEIYSGHFGRSNTYPHLSSRTFCMPSPSVGDAGSEFMSARPRSILGLQSEAVAAFRDIVYRRGESSDSVRCYTQNLSVFCAFTGMPPDELLSFANIFQLNARGVPLTLRLENERAWPHPDERHGELGLLKVIEVPDRRPTECFHIL